jgi:hypothetical protein
LEATVLKSKRMRTLVLVAASVCLPPALMLSACAGSDSNTGGDIPVTTTTTDTSSGICLLNNCSENVHCAACQDGRNTCLVAENRCVACDPNLPQPGGCPEGQQCSSYGICVPAGLTCPTDAEGVPNFPCVANADCLACSPMNQVCDPQTQRCVACSATNTQHCLQSDVCIDGKCSPKCPTSCTTQNDCLNCGGPGNYAHACFQHKCAQCSDTFPCAQGMVCENGVCIPPCGIPGPVAGDCVDDEDCTWCGGNEAAHGTWLCKKPLNAGATDHGKCGPNAAGCSDLGTSVAVLPEPWSGYTNLCSDDPDCTGTDVGIQYNVGKLIRDWLGADSVDLGFAQLEICDTNFFYAMNKCAAIEISPTLSCGLCVPCAVDADCEPIPIDPMIIGNGSLFCADPLAQLAGALLVNILWGDSPEHNLNFFCQQIVAGYGVCIPCGNPTQACGEGGGQQGSCTHDVCEAGVALGANCDECTAAVCAQDSYCCSDAWDATCVGEVADYCAGGCGGQSSCAHGPCVVGDALDANCSACATAVCAADSFCCNSSWDDVCVAEAQGITECAAECAGGCAHSECTTGAPPADAPLDAGCSACATAVCALDPYCCESGWDQTCVDEAIAEAACPDCV